MMEFNTAEIEQMQKHMLEALIEMVQGWMKALLCDTFNPESFLRFVTSMGIDLSKIPNLVGQVGGFDPYRVLGLEKTATDGEVKKRYRELLVKLHPDTAGVRGTDFLLQMMIAAYGEIAKERGW
jgi:DnaJ-domain-containing protein 1